MNKILRSALLAVMVVFSSASAFAQAKGDKITVGNLVYKVLSDNLISNPGFDKGFTGWTGANDFSTEITDAGFKIQTEDGHGNYLVGTTNSGAGDAKSLGTAWDIEAGKMYYFAYDVKSLSDAEGEQGYLVSSIANTKGDETETLGKPTLTKGQWTTFENVFTNSSDYAYAQVKFRWLNNLFGFDNFKLYEIEEVYADITSAYLTNASFETGDLTGWTLTASGDTGVKGNVSPYTTTGIVGSHLFNCWDGDNKSYPLTQTVNLPIGKYALSVLCAGLADKNVVLFVNDKDGNTIVSNAQKVAAGAFTKNAVTFELTEAQSVTIGVAGSTTAEAKNDAWYKVDNFVLSHDVYYAAYRDVIDEYDAALAAWQAVTSQVNVWDAQVKDEVWKSTVKGDALDLMNKANDILVEVKAAAENALADESIVSKKAALLAKIAEVGKAYTTNVAGEMVGNALSTELIDQACAKAVENWAIAEAALKVAKAIPTGTYYIKTTGGKFFAPANSGESQASLVDYSVEWKLAAIKNGVYTFESVVSNGKKDGKDQFYFNGSYCDGFATNIIISAGSADGQYYFQTADDKFVTSDSKYIVQNGVAVLEGAKASALEFVLVPTNKTDAATLAAYAADKDVTFFIKDANIGRHNRYESAWTKTGGATAAKSSVAADKEDADTRYSMESYQKAFSVSQALTVPEGYYTLNVQAFYRQDGKKEALPVIFANNEEKTVKARTGSENDMQAAATTLQDLTTYNNTVEVHVAANGKLNVGIKADDNSVWAIWKNFTLKFNNKDNTAYEAQTKTNLLAAWKNVQDNYNAVKAELGTDYDKDGAVLKALNLVKDNTTSTKDAKDKDGKDIKIRNGWGINDVAASNPHAKSFEPTRADSLYNALAAIANGIDNYLENIAIAEDLNDSLASIKPLWQAAYDIINYKYNAEKVLDGTEAPEFAKEMQGLRAEFVKELSTLNDIDALASAIKNDTISKYLVKGTLQPEEEQIGTQIDDLKQDIIATLKDAQLKSYKTIIDAIEEKDALYIEAIKIIDDHYAANHKAAANEAQLKLFAIHKTLATITDEATEEYTAVVKANDALLAKNEVPTEGFGYAEYVKQLETVNVGDIAQYLEDANDAAIIDNNQIIADSLDHKVSDGKGGLKTVSGWVVLESNFNKAVKGTDYYTLTTAKIAANADKKYDEKVVAIAKNLLVLQDTLNFYKNIHDAKYMTALQLKAVRDRGILVYELDKDGKETTTPIDTIFCIHDVMPAITKLFADIETATAALAEAVLNSEDNKAELDELNTDLKTLWNKSYAGLNEALDEEVDLQEIYEGIESIRINKIENKLFIYDEKAYNEDKSQIEEWSLALTDYSKWVVDYHEQGDANKDGDVTIADVILQISYLLEEKAIPGTKLDKYVTDADGDGAFDINDVQKTINKALGEEEDDEEVAEAQARVAGQVTDYVVVGAGEIGLVNTKAYASFQMDVTVAEGATFNAPELSSRAAALTVKYNKIADNTYRVVAYSLKKAAIEENEGALVLLNIDGNENVTVANAIFSDGKNKYTLDVFTEEETAIAGINAAAAEEGAAIYSVNGAKQNTLQKGINIVKGADGSVRKVLVK